LIRTVLPPVPFSISGKAKDQVPFDVRQSDRWSGKMAVAATSRKA